RGQEHGHLARALGIRHPHYPRVINIFAEVHFRRARPAGIAPRRSQRGGSHGWGCHHATPARAGSPQYSGKTIAYAASVAFNSASAFSSALATAAINSSMIVPLNIVFLLPYPQPAEPASNSFRGPQLGAARTRVPSDLLSRCSHRLFCQQPVNSVAGSLAQRVFHDAVLQRVETDDHQPPARPKHAGRHGFTQQSPQIVQFAVYENSDCLESARRRMNALMFHWPGRGPYNIRQLLGGMYRPRPDNGSGDSPRPPFLT